MNAANLPPASVLRPELRARLERLEQLERRERQSRYARWHIPAPAEREPEGWLLTYLDLITLLLVMLVVMLAFSQPKTPAADPMQVAAVETPAAKTAHPEQGSGLQAQAGTTEPAPAVQAASLPAPLDGPVAATPDAAANVSVDPSPATALPDLPAIAPAAPASGPGQEPSDGEAGLVPGAQQRDDPALKAVDLTDRPAPVDVTLVGSVRMSPSLQAALPSFSYDLKGISAAPIAVTMADAPPEDMAAAQPDDAAQGEKPIPSNATPILPAAGDTPDRSADPASTAPASLDELGLNGLGDNIDVIINEESVSFRINNEILFTSGQADLMPSGLEVLTRLAGVLARNDYQIAVEGHTDPVPIQNDRFPSNWELSTGRATSVLRHLQSQGIPASRLRATGYADTRPIAPNDSPAGRAFNRRVELIMEMPRNARKTPQSSSSASAAAPLSLSGSDSTGPIVRLR